jgi:hypothetical protein
VYNALKLEIWVLSAGGNSYESKIASHLCDFNYPVVWLFFDDEGPNRSHHAITFANTEPRTRRSRESASGTEGLR